MLIIVQFPLADLRPFIEEDAQVPVATEFSQRGLAGTSDYGGTKQAPFLPSVGPLRKRRQGAQYAGESLYFKAKGALQFDADLRSVPDPRNAAPIGVTVFFRRFQAYQDLHQLARCELALLLDMKGLDALDSAGCEALLRSCLALPVRVPGDPAWVPLIQAGPRLAAHLLRATTRRREPTPPDWTLQARTPTLLVEYGDFELAAPPKGARGVAVPEAPELKLAAAGLTIEKVPSTVWCLSTGVQRVNQDWFSSDVDANRRDQARQLRINLLRHHAEREVLAQVLDCILLPGRLKAHAPGLASARLNAYLLRAAARLTRSQRFGFSQGQIAQAATGIEAAAQAVDSSSESRYHELWEHLANVLDVDLFTTLYEALPQLPMGSPLETAQLRKLLQDARCPPRKVAVSYAHVDTRLMQSFVDHMEQAVRQGMVEPWDDRWIVAGSDWQAEIDQRFKQAQVVVLLVSEDFLKSKYCLEVEVPLVLERASKLEAVVVPVIVRPCAWAETILKGRQAVLPHGRPVVANGNRAEAWRIVIHEMLVGSRALTATPAAAVPP